MNKSDELGKRAMKTGQGIFAMLGIQTYIYQPRFECQYCGKDIPKDHYCCLWQWRKFMHDTLKANLVFKK